MVKEFTFPRYENDPNFPTYAFRQHSLSYSEKTRRLTMYLAKGGVLKSHFEGKMPGFLSLVHPDQGKFREYVASDWVLCAIAEMNWVNILTALRGPVNEEGLTNLDMLAIAYFETIPGIWQTVVKDERYPDGALKDWAANNATIFIENCQGRVYGISPLYTFVRGCLETAMAAVDWKRLEESLGEEE